MPWAGTMLVSICGRNWAPGSVLAYPLALLQHIYGAADADEERRQVAEQAGTLTNQPGSTGTWSAITQLPLRDNAVPAAQGFDRQE